MIVKNKLCIIVRKFVVNYFRKIIIFFVFRKGFIDGDNYGKLDKFIWEVKKNKNGKIINICEV